MGGFSNAPRCPAFLTFRDSPALVRQESDGYPVRPVFFALLTSPVVNSFGKEFKLGLAPRETRGSRVPPDRNVYGSPAPRVRD